MSSPFRVGVEAVLPGSDWWATIYGQILGEAFTPDIFARSLKELGAEFTLFYDSLAPREPRACERIADLCERVGIDYLYNNTYGDIYGPWAPGTGRAEYSDEVLAYAAKGQRFRGVVLDEVEHRQIHHFDCGKGPYLADVVGCTVEEAYERVLAGLQAVAGRHHRFDGMTVGEMVFPVLTHVLARAGVTPAPKLLAVNYPAVAYAACVGAAMQYGTPLWAVLDFWSTDAFWGQQGAFAPGFSPQTYQSFLQLAYWLGFDATYTEGLHNLIWLRQLSPSERQALMDHPLGHRSPGEGGFLIGKSYALNAYGKIHRWFTRHWLPGQDRPYTFRDLRPRVAIVRMPDGCWRVPTGGKGPFDNPFYGPGGPSPDRRHTAWLDLWHVLTHGVVPRDCISLTGDKAYLAHRNAVANDPYEYDYQEHLPFVPMDGVVVFDHLVGKSLLGGAELIVLTGHAVSGPTLRAVMDCVAAGADCLAAPHLAGPELARGGDATPRLVWHGQGSILLTDDFAGDAARRFIAPHLGPANAIRYRFGEHLMDVRLCSCCGSQLVLQE
jgi:hypothetical protein